jgi:hypothetical protein
MDHIDSHNYASLMPVTLSLIFSPLNIFNER